LFFNKKKGEKDFWEFTDEIALLLGFFTIEKHVSEIFGFPGHKDVSYPGVPILNPAPTFPGTGSFQGTRGEEVQGPDHPPAFQEAGGAATVTRFHRSLGPDFAL
jgi:hypothetical protein